MSALGKILDFLPERSSPNNLPAPVSKILFDLQIQQLKHDEAFHKEICALSVHNRINHMSLHFAKYTGQIMELLASKADIENRQQLKQTITDTFVICLILANILNKNLSDCLKDIDLENIANLEQLGSALGDSKGDKEENLHEFLFSLATANGRIARACEKLDHLEAYPFREDIFIGLLEIFKSTLIIASQQNINLSKSVKARLTEIEKRSIFFDRY